MLETVEIPRRLVMYHHILPEQRDRFVNWVNHCFCPAIMRIENLASCDTRVLASSVPNQDGSYTYVILMDPACSDTDYSIPALLERAYGAGEGQEYIREWSSTLASSKVDYVLVEGFPRVG